MGHLCVKDNRSSDIGILFQVSKDCATLKVSVYRPECIFQEVIRAGSGCLISLHISIDRTDTDTIF